MLSFQQISQFSSALGQIYLSQQAFWKRFSLVSRLEDPFVRIYDICEDNFNNKRKVAIKDYGSSSQQQCKDVMTNLSSYIHVQKIEEICKLVAFCQQETTGDIRAAFEYNDFSLEEMIEKRYCQEFSYDFYLFLLKQLTLSLQNFNNVGINLEQLVFSSILLFQKEDYFGIKILYDEREKKYDKIQQGIKVFCSAQMINAAINESSHNQTINCDEAIFEMGLLLLDIIYLYESSAPKKSQNQSGTSFVQTMTTRSALFKGYLIFQNHQMCYLNRQLINLKIDYIKSLNSIFLNELISLVCLMVNKFEKRIKLRELTIEVEKMFQYTTKEKLIKLPKPLYEPTKQEISPVKSKGSSGHPEDSLRYSDSYRCDNFLKKPLISQTTLPTLNTISFSDKIQSDQCLPKRQNKVDFFIIPKEKILQVKCHPKIKSKLQLFLIELQNKVNLIKHDYYDSNTYYGEIDKINQKRMGLGIYIYTNGQIYFGIWKNNSFIEGTYIFKNGESFEGNAKNGKQGKGTYYYSNGSIYQGDWLDDLKHGFGKMFYNDGDSYDGMWMKGKRNGSGTYFYNNGTIYRGGFVNGLKHGKGIIDFTDGTKVEASWFANHIEGKGKIYYQNGDYFEGFFNYSAKQGVGEYCWSDSTKYWGCFKKDCMEGEAKIKFDQNQYYEGHISRGKRQGQGYYRYSNGDQFRGIWKNDEKYSGIYVYSTGGSFEGRFKNGEMSKGVMIYSNGQAYQGQFLEGVRHGVGVYKNAGGQVKFEGRWIQDKFMQ